MNDVTVVVPCKETDFEPIRRIRSEANCRVIVVHDRCYGEAIKEGVRKARTPYIITMDADGQHTIKEAEKLYQAFKLAQCDLMIGDRRLKYSEPVRAIASTFINIVASSFAGRWVVDLNSGLRIFKREIALKYERVLCDKFSYTTTLAMAHLADGLRVEWFPINVYPRYSGRSHVSQVKDGLKTLYYIVKIGGALRTRRIRGWLRNWTTNLRSG